MRHMVRPKCLAVAVVRRRLACIATRDMTDLDQALDART
jgi:hypothetical protein